MSQDQEQFKNVVFLTNVRLSFPHIAKPQEAKEANKKAKYNAEFIIAPDNLGWARFFEIVNRLATDKWKHQAQQVMQMIQNDRKKRCFGWGQEKVNQTTLKLYDGYEGMYFIGANRDQMPDIIDHLGQRVDPTNSMACQTMAARMYGGCYVNACIRPWLQENEHGRGIRADFLSVQFHADGTPFGEGATDTAAMYSATPQAPSSTPGGAPSWGPPGGVQQPQTMPAPPTWGPPQMPGAPAAAAQPWMR